MAKVERFEELVAWQKARVLTKELYRVTRGGVFSKDFSLRDQIRSASCSIMSNIAEGFERGDQNFINSSLSQKPLAQRYAPSCMSL